MNHLVLNNTTVPPTATRPLVAVYCGSRAGHHGKYRDAAIAFAQGIAQLGLGMVYGGASIGLMGQMADSVLQHGANVVGVIPKFMLDYEIAHAHLTELHIVDSMHERKALMAERASAFVALPGGLGTFEEILEIATWRQLNQHHKPVLVLNQYGYYDALMAQLDHAVNEGFLSPQHRAQLLFCPDLATALLALEDLRSLQHIAL